MAVTRPQTQPGVVEDWESDLGEAVAYAREHKDEPAESAALYGGVPGGINLEAEQMIRSVMEQLMDAQQAVPSP
jgi:sphinganine-1-phosphate aldolase